MKKLTAIGFLLLAVFFKQLAWIAFIPLWQTPDEQAHFAQVSLLAETGQNTKLGNDLSLEIYTAEKILGTDRDQMGNNKFTYHPEYKSSYTPQLEKQISDQPVSSRTEFIGKEAAGYPPLYYKIAATVYRIFYFGSLFDRVFAVRFISALALVATTWVAYKVGKIMAGETEALILAALVGFQPMLTFVNTGVTSDTLYNLLFAVFILLCLRLLEKIRLPDLILLGLTAWLAMQTKVQAYTLGFIALPIIFTSKWLILAALLLFLPLIKFIRTDRLMVPETSGIKFSGIFSSAMVEHIKFTLGHTYREVLPWYWGVFRWLSLGLPEVLRKITNWVTVFSFLGFGIYLIKNTNRKVLFMVYAAVVYFLALTAFDFAFRQSHGYSFGIQGRYFFPVIIPLMTIMVLGFKPVAKYLAAGMIALNVIVFFWLVGSYYQLSWPAFFFEAGQYKPLWLKMPVNLLLLGLYLLWSLLSLRFIMKKR